MTDINEESRLVELETKMAYMEENLSQINKGLFEQSKSLDRLRRDFNEFTDRLVHLESGQGNPNPGEKPPHY